MTCFKLILTAVFWGGTFITGKIIAPGVDPYSAAFLRFLIASICLTCLTIKIEGSLPKLTVNKIFIVFLLGFTGVFSYNLFFFSGLKFVQANQASLIIANNPIFISLCSAFFFKEKLGFYKILGLFVSVTGALIVISNGNLPAIFTLGLGKGELLIFGCVASWVAYSILGKQAMNELSPIVSVCYSSIAGTLLLFFPAFFKGVFKNMTVYQPVEWACLFYLGFFGTVLGFLWYYEGIKKIGPVKAGIFINFVPVSAIILAFIFLKESITVSLFFGAILVIAGVYLTNNAGSKGR